MYQNMIKVKNVLDKYSFESKIIACQYYSLKNMDKTGINLEAGKRKIPAPWYLEMIVLLSIYFYDDYKNDIIDENTFLNVVNDLHSINILEDNSNENILRDFILAIAAIQFRVQRNIYRDLYRYNYYFSFENEKLNLKKEFYKKFNCDFWDFCLFVYDTWNLFLLKKDGIENKKNENYNRKINTLMQKLALKYNIPFKNLSVDFYEYRKMLQNMNLELDNFYAITRPSYAFPFIEKDNVIYLPLPHLLVISSTEFLMTRLTEGNDKLRSAIGNVVYEKYLYDVISDSNYFDEIYGEQSYIYKKQKMKTIDIMCKIDNDVVFFDRKSSVPGHKISIADEKDVSKNITVMGKACAQMYKHLKLKYSKEYNPFKNNFVACDNNKWGIVVVEIDSYIPRNDIYDKAKELLLDEGIENVDDDWMSKHIIITDIDCVESFFFFCPEELLVKLKNKAFNNGENDFIDGYVPYNQQLRNNKIFDFTKNLISSMSRDLLNNLF